MNQIRMKKIRVPGSILIAGVDEAGRGPLVGAVVAAAVILPESYDLPGLTDSKKLTHVRRERLESLIKSVAIAWAVAEASCEEIDQINILQASLLAMQRAVQALNYTPDKVLVDGNRAPKLAQPTECIVKGDLSEACISAASILAKQSRDRKMVLLDKQYPQYGFAQHKGYPTRAHREALLEYGVCPQHRTSFRPVREALNKP